MSLIQGAPETGHLRVEPHLEILQAWTTPWNKQELRETGNRWGLWQGRQGEMYYSHRQKNFPDRTLWSPGAPHPFPPHPPNDH